MKRTLFSRRFLTLALMMGVGTGLVAQEFSNKFYRIVEPDGIMGKSPVWSTLKVCDPNNEEARKIQKMIEANGEYKKLLERYYQEQFRHHQKDFDRMIQSGKSREEATAEVEKKIKPLNIVVQANKGQILMDSGTAIIKDRKGNEIDRDFQYVSPKIKIHTKDDNYGTNEQENMNAIAHETAHALMKVMYGYVPKSVEPWKAFGHYDQKISTSQLAWTEGFAEFYGAYVSGEAENGPYFQHDDHWYPKNYKENLKTEGNNALFLLHLSKTEKSGIENGMEKILEVMREKHPWSLKSFMDAFKEKYPQDAGKVDALIQKDLVTPQGKLITAQMDVQQAIAKAEAAKKAYEGLSWFKNPIQKGKALWELKKRQKLAKTFMDRYQGLGFTEAELLKPPFAPKPKPAAQPQVAVGNSAPVKPVAAPAQSKALELQALQAKYKEAVTAGEFKTANELKLQIQKLQGN